MPTPPLTTPRPVLRPGVHVLRRTSTELQVGLDPNRAVVVPDREPYRSTLTSLGSPAAPPDQRRYDDHVVALLRDAGLLVDADRLLALMPPAGEGTEGAEGAGPRARDVAALASRSGDATGSLLDRRSQRVEVLTYGSPAVTPLADELRSHLERAGVPTSSGPGPEARSRRGRARAAEEPLAVGVLVVVGEPPRELVDRWMCDGTPYVVLRLTEADALLGPFVVPGRTACLRCVDAHLTDVDPAWPLLVVQYAAACAGIREDALPEPCDPVLASLAAAWTARDVLTQLEGGSPSTASGTVRLRPDLSCLESQTWSRHPGCGCAWA